MIEKNQPLPDALILIHDATDLGGAELHLLEILKVCRKRGIPAYLITSKAGTLFEQFKKLTKAQCIVPIPYPRKPKTWLRMPVFLKTCKRFIKNINAKKTCIFVGDFYPLWAALKLKPLAPIISLWQGEYRFDSNECPKKWIRYGANRADLLLANEAICKHASATGLLKRPLLPLNPRISKTRFNPHKHDREALREKFLWSQKTAVCVGRYGEGKGQPWLVDQFLNDAELYKNWRLVLIGTISEADKCSLEKALSKRKGGHKVSIWCERHDIPEIYAAADVALFPGIVQESYGLAVLEAVTMHIPIIAMASGALPYLLENTLELIPMGSRKTLIKKWKEDPFSNVCAEGSSIAVASDLEKQISQAFESVSHETSNILSDD